MINASSAKKLATMACYCPHVRCFDCNNYGHITVDCPAKSHLQAYQQDAGTITLVDIIDQHLRVTVIPGITTVTIEIGTGSADLDLAPIILDIEITVTVTLTEVTLDPFINPHATAHHATEARAHTATAETHPTANPHHAGVSPKMTVDPEHAHPANTITKPQKDHLPVHIQHPGSPKTGSTNKSQLMTCPQSTIALMNRTVTQRMV